MLLLLWCLHRHPDRVLLRLQHQFFHPRRTQWTRQMHSQSNVVLLRRLQLPQQVCLLRLCGLGRCNPVRMWCCFWFRHKTILLLCHFLLLCGGCNFGVVLKFCFRVRHRSHFLVTLALCVPCCFHLHLVAVCFLWDFFFWCCYDKLCHNTSVVTSHVDRVVCFAISAAVNWKVAKIVNWSAEEVSRDAVASETAQLSQMINNAQGTVPHLEIRSSYVCQSLAKRFPLIARPHLQVACRCHSLWTFWICPQRGHCEMASKVRCRVMWSIDNLSVLPQKTTATSAMNELPQGNQEERLEFDDSQWKTQFRRKVSSGSARAQEATKWILKVDEAKASEEVSLATSIPVLRTLTLGPVTQSQQEDRRTSSIVCSRKRVALDEEKAHSLHRRLQTRKQMAFMIFAYGKLSDPKEYNARCVSRISWTLN